MHHKPECDVLTNDSDLNLHTAILILLCGPNMTNTFKKLIK